MQSELLRIFAALEASKARYLLVGGVAVVLHGHLRFTADVDLIVSLQADNARAAVRALGDLGFRPRAPVNLDDFADPQLRKEWVESKGLTVFSLWNPAMPGTEIDLFVEEPLEFEQAWGRARHVVIAGTRVIVASISDLIALKRKAGRPKDLEDITALEAIARVSERGES